jgi:hypothetical protein
MSVVDDAIREHDCADKHLIDHARFLSADPRVVASRAVRRQTPTESRLGTIVKRTGLAEVAHKGNATRPSMAVSRIVLISRGGSPPNIAAFSFPRALTIRAISAFDQQADVISGEQKYRIAAGCLLIPKTAASHVASTEIRHGNLNCTNDSSEFNSATTSRSS